jgi:hypothetical protein
MKTRPMGVIERALGWSGMRLLRQKHRTRTSSAFAASRLVKTAHFSVAPSNPVPDEKPRPMGIKGRGQSGIRRSRIKRLGRRLP